MKELDIVSNQYINEDIKCIKTINLTGSKTNVKFINNKKYLISVNLIYDAGRVIYYLLFTFKPEKRFSLSRFMRTSLMTSRKCGYFRLSNR